jgi:O-Antigen ligase
VGILVRMILSDLKIPMGAFNLKGNINFLKVQKIIFMVLLAGLCAVFSLPSTIAIRYSFGALLLILVVLLRPEWRLIVASNRIFLLFIAYIFLHFYFLTDHIPNGVYLINSQWLNFILFSFLGFGVGAACFKYKFKNLYLILGFAFSTPIIIHVAQIFWQWQKNGVMPFAYWGIFPHHEMLGYAAILTILFIGVDFLFHPGGWLRKLMTLSVILLCLFSNILANGRAGSIFTVITPLMLVFFANFFAKKYFDISMQKKMGLALTIIFLGMVAIFIASKYDGGRWKNTISNLTLGFQIKEPLKVVCDGPQILKNQFHDSSKSNVEIDTQINKFFGGDSSRTLVALASLEALKKYPLGIDGSKNSYSIAVDLACGHPRYFKLEHAHNGWLNMSFAIGIPGAIIYFLLLLSYTKYAVSFRKEGGESIYPEAVMLSSFAMIWILRAFFDDVHKDHMLQMQGFIMMLLFGYLSNCRKYQRI